MKTDANTLRIGNVIEHQGRLWRIVKMQHVKPGKGGAFQQMELKDIRSGTKLNERFRSSATLEKVRLEQRPHQFLFADGETYHFMDKQSYEQVALGESLIDAETARFLRDGLQVTIEFFENTPIGMTLPDTVTLAVVEADAVVKGQTAASSYKPAVLENGVKIMVPAYIESGIRIVVNTADCTFAERAKD